MTVGVIIPVKRLRDSKKRLSSVLSKSERSKLVKAMFFDVLKISSIILFCGEQDTIIVSR